jgi:RimJ/RimL family protein N-acetyltransferase
VTTSPSAVRQWRGEEVQPLHEIYEQPEFLATIRAKTLDDTRAQLDWLRRARDGDGYCHWAACDLESGRPIGRIGLQCHRDWPLSNRPVPEVGWVRAVMERLGFTHWRKAHGHGHDVVWNALDR